MKLGAEPKRLGILALLVVVAGYFLYSNISTGPSGPQGGATPPKAR